jgi:signal transduction histidine kinase
MTAPDRSTLVVLADDSALARRLQLRLEKSGHEVIGCKPADASPRTLAGTIDLVIIVEPLSGTTGIEVHQKINAASEHVPTILVAQGDVRNVVAALRAGIVDFVPRTDDFLPDLVSAIERLLKQTRTERRLRDEFLAVLAHELRNPLAPILNALHIMRLASHRPAALEESRAIIERQVRQMVRLMDDLLDLSRITRGKIQLRKQSVDLGQAIHNAVESSRSAIESAGHELSVSLPDKPIIVEADPTRLTQIVLNLLDNAIRYTEPGGHIEVTAEQRGGEAILTVRDNGIGIPPELLPNVFETFAQVDRLHGRSQGGLGIGLSLVRGLVRLHGGTVTAHSEGTGQGSEFTVAIPRGSAAKPPPAVPAPETAVPRKRGVGRRVLVVEDHVDGAHSLRTLLNVLGHEARVVHDGAAALEEARRFRPHIAILDIGLPGMNGYQLARLLRKIPELSDLLMVAMTGWGSEEDRKKSRDAGFNAHLVKPVELRDLEALLSHAGAVE